MVFAALLCTLTGIWGNVILNEDNIQYFFLYFGFALLLVGMMFFRVYILRMLIRGLVRKSDGSEIDLTIDEIPRENYRKIWRYRLANTFIGWLQQVLEQKIIFFIKETDIRLMNKAIEYVRANEQTQVIQFVHVYNKRNDTSLNTSTASENGELVTVQEISKAMHDDVLTLQRIYPKMKLDFVVISSQSQFKGSLVKKISERLGVPAHFMFISCPGRNFSFDIAQLGGVRLITGIH